MNRLKNSEATRSAKSFGDSIKKHIFHKGIISRTPKRATATTPVGIETPNYFHTKQPKLRVLFQSPSSSSASASAEATPEKLHGNMSSLPAAQVTNTHPLQKSISSSSLLLLNASVQQSSGKEHNDGIEGETSSSCSSSTNSSDGLPKQISRSVSAPVSRQCSHDLPIRSSAALNHSNSSTHSTTSSTASSQNFHGIEADCCATPLKIISEAARQLIVGGGGGGVGVAGGGSEIMSKKSVGWHDDHHQLLEVDDSSAAASSDTSTANELRSRYKSEPNLSRMFKEKMVDIPETVPEHLHTPVLKANVNVVAGKSLTRKLIKGVSMSNIKFPFSTPESTKRLVRSVSSTLKRRHSDESQTAVDIDGNNVPWSASQFMKLPLIENDHGTSFDDDLDDETFEDDPNDHVESDSDEDEADETLGSNVDALVAASSSSNSSDMPDSACGGGGGGYKQILVQPSGLYRNIDLITSTPSLLLGRRSMSPITKSAQRMPKSMQESIMTPRSRKPVMVLTTTLGSSDQNQTIYQNDLSSFREQDEDSSSTSTDHPNLLSEDAISVGSYTELMNKKSRQASFNDPANSEVTYEDDEQQRNKETIKAGVLSQNFKEYLRSRSVLTDSSFSSHPDDFKDDDDDDDVESDSDCPPQEIGDLNESQLSPSLLYCLDGNEPMEEARNNADEETFSTPRAHISRRSLASLNNARKRAASNNSAAAKLSTTTPSPTKSEVTSSSRVSSVAQSLVGGSNKENQEIVDDYILSKKVLISDFPNETSF